MRQELRVRPGGLDCVLVQDKLGELTRFFHITSCEGPLGELRQSDFQTHWDAVP
jgi:hypothetical protein